MPVATTVQHTLESSESVSWTPLWLGVELRKLLKQVGSRVSPFWCNPKAWMVVSAWNVAYHLQTSVCSSVSCCWQLCPGGGFGPVADHGYGVSYMLPGDARLYFHISSKRSASQTDSSRFARLLFESLHDMRQMFYITLNGNSNWYRLPKQHW